MQDKITFILDNQVATIDFSINQDVTPTTTVLNYLRQLPNHKGVKEGCAEGDCGACTVVIAELGKDGRLHYKNIDSCLVFLPALHGKLLVTVENLKDQSGKLHPVQEMMVETGGSQCGFCTPGIIMSMFALYKTVNHPTAEHIDNALTGNLCRCTGYRPIAEATAKSCVLNGRDLFTEKEPQVTELLKSIPRETISIKTQRQEYFRPLTLLEALEFMYSNPDAIIINGSTDVALRVTKNHEILGKVLDISAVQELRLIEETKFDLTLGSGVCLTEVEEQVRSKFPALSAMLNLFGSQQIRNVATLGGNLGTASPISDTIPVLMAYNAKIRLQSIDTVREVAIDDYIIGYRKTIRQPNEFITAIILSKDQHNPTVKSYKISKRKDLDISTVSAGFRLELNKFLQIDDIKLVFGGMADRVKRAPRAEAFLRGNKWTRENVEQAMPLIERDFSPISDARGSAEFRKIAARNLLLKFWCDTETESNE